MRLSPVSKFCSLLRVYLLLLLELGPAFAICVCSSCTWVASWGCCLCVLAPPGGGRADHGNCTIKAYQRTGALSDSVPGPALLRLLCRWRCCSCTWCVFGSCRFSVTGACLQCCPVDECRCDGVVMVVVAWCVGVLVCCCAVAVVCWCGGGMGARPMQECSFGPSTAGSRRCGATRTRWPRMRRKMQWWCLIARPSCPPEPPPPPPTSGLLEA
jgi:hypothetical protein